MGRGIVPIVDWWKMARQIPGEFKKDWRTTQWSPSERGKFLFSALVVLIASAFLFPIFLLMSIPWAVAKGLVAGGKKGVWLLGRLSGARPLQPVGDDEDDFDEDEED